MAQITDLYIYPVKSLKGIALKEAHTGIRGFRYDREWMITDSHYHFISQREIESMATLEASINKDSLILHSNTNQLSVPLDSEKLNQVRATVWDDICDAYDEGDEASNWLTNELGEYKGSSLRLVRFSAKGERSVPEQYLNGVKAQSAFSDQFPYLITSWESLSKLNQGLNEKKSKEVSMNRFRPNIVVQGVDDLEKMTASDLSCDEAQYSFGLRKPCKRCKIVTINQDTGEIMEPKEPLATLVKLKFSDAIKGAFFGQNAILLSDDCTIRVGDELTLSS
ncbi:MAG: MOSC domain-containing protein [Thiotrichales bacterium]|jgi:hypothetical protein|nr:MOSC domain-containing protein [Thiotrichales bacterium]MBT7150712.1 MOSC domain-containing protein [Thiotrichales bacterium]